MTWNKDINVKVLVRVLLVVFVVAMLITVAIVGKFRQEHSWICGKCGTRKYQTQWVLGIRSELVVKTSALEQWILAKHERHEHRWKYVGGLGTNVFGRFVSSSSKAPFPHLVFMAPGTMTQYVENATDAELENLVKTLDTGEKIEKERLLREICGQ